MSFSEKLKEARRNKGLSQEVVAEYCGVSRQSVSKWETGEAEPGLGSLKKLKKLLKISLDELLMDEITDFENIVRVDTQDLIESWKKEQSEQIAIALIGASPMVNGYVQNCYPKIEFAALKQRMQPIQITKVEQTQQLLEKINANFS